MVLTSYTYTGTKYDPSLGVAEIAKKVRAEIKTAIASGDLPAFKCSVRIARFSGGQALRVTIKGIPKDFPIWGSPGIKKSLQIEESFGTSHEDGSLSKEMAEALDKLEAIRGAYGHHEGDTQRDYQYSSYYGGVSIHHSCLTDPDLTR